MIGFILYERGGERGFTGSEKDEYCVFTNQKQFREKLY